MLAHVGKNRARAIFRHAGEQLVQKIPGRMREAGDHRLVPFGTARHRTPRAEVRQMRMLRFLIERGNCVGQIAHHRQLAGTDAIQL